MTKGEEPSFRSSFNAEIARFAADHFVLRVGDVELRCETYTHFPNIKILDLLPAVLKTDGLYEWASKNLVQCGRGYLIGYDGPEHRTKYAILRENQVIEPRETPYLTRKWFVFELICAGGILWPYLPMDEGRSAVSTGNIDIAMLLDIANGVVDPFDEQQRKAMLAVSAI